MQSNDETRRRLIRKAEAMEVSLELTEQAERDTVELLEKLGRFAAELFEYAQEWDDVNPQIAARVRQHEQQVHALRAQVERLGAFEADEATKIMARVKQTLRQARGEQG